MKKVRVINKVVPVHAVKARKGCGGTAPSILNLGTRWRWAANFTLYFFTAGKDDTPIYMHGPHRGSGHFGEEKHVLPLPGIQLRTLQPQASVMLLQ